MKKVISALIVAGAVLVPSAAMADSTVVIGGVVATSSGSTGSTSTVTDSTTSVPISIPFTLTPAQAKKADHDAVQQAKHDEHPPQNGKTTADQTTSVSQWDDPSLILNGGWKLS